MASKDETASLERERDKRWKERIKEELRACERVTAHTRNQTSLPALSAKYAEFYKYYNQCVFALSVSRVH